MNNKLACHFCHFSNSKVAESTFIASEIEQKKALCHFCHFYLISGIPSYYYNKKEIKNKEIEKKRILEGERVMIKKVAKMAEELGLTNGVVYELGFCHFSKSKVALEVAL